MIRPLIAVVSLALSGALLLLGISAYDRAQRRLAELTAVVGKNVVVVGRGEEADYVRALDVEAFVRFVEQLPGYLRHALRASAGRRPNVFEYYAVSVDRPFFAIRRLRLSKGRVWRPGAIREFRVVGVLAPVAERGGPDRLVDGTVYLPRGALWSGLPDAYYVEFEGERQAHQARARLNRWLAEQGYVEYAASLLAVQYGIELRRRLRHVLGGALLWGLAALLVVTGVNLATYFFARGLDRIREFGIRRAVGARPRAIQGLILREAFAWVLPGLGLGLVLSLLLAGVFEAKTGLAGGPTPLATLGAGVGLAAVCLAAAYGPAAWAVRQPPGRAIRGFAATLPQRRVGLAMAGLALALAVLFAQGILAHSAEVHARKMVGGSFEHLAVYSSFLFVGAHALTDPRGVTPLSYEDYQALLASPLARKLSRTAYVEAYLIRVRGPSGEAFTYLRAFLGPYPELVEARLLAGRWPRPGRGEAAIGAALARELFGKNPLGGVVYALGLEWKVVGVFRGGAEALPGNLADRQLLVLREDLGGSLPRARAEILVRKKPGVPPGVFEAIAAFLTERHRDPKLTPVRPLRFDDLAPDVRKALHQVAGVVAARLETRAIGIRRAVGASRGRVFLGLIGPFAGRALIAAIAGLGLGAGAAYGVLRVQEAAFSVPWGQVLAILLLAPIFAAGWAALPAWLAAGASPAEAMRVE